MRPVCISAIISFVSLAIVLALSVPANADSVIDRYFRGSHINFELSDDSITSVAKFEAEVEMRYRNGDFSGFVRGSNDRPFAFQTSPFELEKRGLAYNHGGWLVQAGDYSLVYGRGLALNAIEERTVDRDAQLDGLLAKRTVGDVDMTAFWGTHKSDRSSYFVSGVNTDSQGPADTLRGVRLDGDFKKVDVGAGWLDAKMTRSGEPTSTAVTEIDGSWHPGDFSLNYETAFFKRPRSEDSEESVSNNGRGQFAELGYASKGISLSSSWVLYDNALFLYATAPTLKRTELENSAAHPDDETGYRFDSHFSPKGWNGHAVRLLYSNVWARKAEGEGDRNLFIEWTTPTTKEWSAIVSYDNISGFQQNYGAISGSDTSYRFSLDGPCPLGGTFHFQSRYRLLKSSAANDDELQLGVDWNVSDAFILSLFRETSTRPTEPPPPGIIGIPTKSPGEWNSGAVKWTPDPWDEFDLFVGSQRGGFQCSGGVCAQIPPFKGVRITYYRTI